MIESGNLTDHQMKEFLDAEVAEENKGTNTNNVLLSPLIKEPEDEHQPFVCFNKSNVAPDSNKAYGYFKRKIITKGNFDYNI